MSEELNRLRKKLNQKNRIQKQVKKRDYPLLRFLSERQERRFRFIRELLFIQRRVQPYDISVDLEPKTKPKRRLSYIG